MKTIPVALAAQYASGASTLARFLRIDRSDGQVFGLTETDRPVVVSGVTYEPGLDISELAFSAGLAVDNLEILVFPNAANGAIDSADVLAGKWDNSTFSIFECDYKNPAGGINLLRRGTTGVAEETRGNYKLELRSLKQALQQSVGVVTSKTCRYRLGSTDEASGGFCMVDLVPWTHTYLITAVDGTQPRRIFTCSAAVEADDYYGEGTATSDDAANAGYSQKVKSFAAGVFTLFLPMPFDVVVGDSFTFVAGCRKRLEEDCRDKFDNVLNFGGEPHVPGIDLLTADPDVNVS